MITESNGIGEALPLAQVAADLTSRTDNTCRTYRAASPVPIGPDDQVLLSVAVRFPTSSVSTFQIGRTSFFLQP